MTEHIGFIGLGIMGRGMAANLIKAGFALTVWNRTRERAETLAAAGAAIAGSPAELAARVDIIITCVSDTPDVQEVILGQQGVIHGVRPGSLVIDMSTISPAVTRDLAAALAEKGVDMLDAPVSGGSEGAAKGTLSIMVGGQAEALQRALPVLQAMGQRITHVGPNGAGQTVKLVNQVIVVGNCLAMAEGLMLAQAGGVDVPKALEAVSAGAAGSWMLSNRGPRFWRVIGGPASRSPCSKRTCASSWKPPIRTAAAARHRPDFPALPHAGGQRVERRRQPRLGEGVGSTGRIRVAADM